MNITALIPARISSKRLSKKNIKPLNGKPLLFWSIDTALKADCFNFVCVSTESYEIADLVHRNYDENEVQVIMRPKELASDSADLKEVCRHFLDSYPDVEMLHLMMPTYPFRTAERIKNVIMPAIYSGQVARVYSVRPEIFSTFDYWIKSGSDFFRMFRHEPLWCEAGNATYSFMKRDYLYKEPHQWEYENGERDFKITTDSYESIDIDTAEDWEIARKVANGRRCKLRTIVKETLGENDFIVPRGTSVPAFRKFLIAKGCDLTLPVLILKEPPPYFTFLRWPFTGSSKNYYRQITLDILSNLPSSGHSQDFPEHFIQSSEYRVLRKNKDQSGIVDLSVHPSQIIHYKELKKWEGFVEPLVWQNDII